MSWPKNGADAYKSRVLLMLVVTRWSIRRLPRETITKRNRIAIRAFPVVEVEIEWLIFTRSPFGRNESQGLSRLSGVIPMANSLHITLSETG